MHRRMWWKTIITIITQLHFFSPLFHQVLCLWDHLQVDWCSGIAREVSLIKLCRV